MSLPTADDYAWAMTACRNTAEMEERRLENMSPNADSNRRAICEDWIQTFRAREKRFRAALFGGQWQDGGNQ